MNAELLEDTIDLVAFDSRTGNVIILAKELMNIEIDPQGAWQFV